MTIAAGWWQRRKQWDNSAFRILIFITFQRRQPNLRLAGIGAVNGLAIMAERLLGKPFGVATGFRTLRPGITVTMQSDAEDPQTGAAASEFLTPIFFLQPSEPRE